MMQISTLTDEGFASFGEVLTIPTAIGRYDAGAALSSYRPGARPSLTLSLRDPVTLPLRVHRMERHAFSSQSFIPLAPVLFVVLVAPHAAADGPDMAQARAFLAGPGQGVTYRADTWHHPMAALDGPAHFAVLMWLDGGAGDEEFVDVAPFIIHLP